MGFNICEFKALKIFTIVSSLSLCLSI
jgi:hypothetical protein